MDAQNEIGGAGTITIDDQNIIKIYDKTQWILHTPDTRMQTNNRRIRGVVSDDEKVFIQKE